MKDDGKEESDIADLADASASLAERFSVFSTTLLVSASSSSSFWRNLPIPMLSYMHVSKYLRRDMPDIPCTNP